MEKKKFYRVCNLDTLQGLWYDFKGNFTGLIHNEFNFCSNCKLPMEYDAEVVGYLSTTDSLEDLYKWFTKEDINNLAEHSYMIYVFESDNYKYYEKFNHWLISEKDFKILGGIML